MDKSPGQVLARLMAVGALTSSHYLGPRWRQMGRQTASDLREVKNVTLLCLLSVIQRLMVTMQ